jgi:hypothetical protein
MPLQLRLKNDHSFGPDDIVSLTTAFKATLSKLGLADRSDPITSEVAILVIDLAKKGERDPDKLCEEAVKILRG